MTFTIGSGWTSSEAATLQQWLAPGSPEMNALSAVSGPPGDSEAITVVKATTGNAGEYCCGTITMASLDLGVLMHELNHATRGTWTLSNSVWEEGLARAAEVREMNMLAAQGVSEAASYWDLYHSDHYDVAYSGMNAPGIAPGATSIHSYTALTLSRYEIAGYAIGKALIQYPGFVKELNAAIFTHPNGDISTSTLESIAAGIAPSVQGRSFSTWYAGQQIFNPTPKIGCSLYQRVTGTFDFFCRDASDAQTPQTGRTVNVSYYDASGRLLQTGSAVTTSLGWVCVPPPPVSAYSGRMKIVASTTTSEGQAITVTRYRPNYTASVPGQGVFGSVRNTNTGTITFSSPSGQFGTFTVSVSNGAFSAPSLESVAGVVRVAFSGSGLTAAATITKDASDYMVLLTAR
jgi:hypothetical protein